MDDALTPPAEMSAKTSVGPSRPALDPILRRFRDALAHAYGDRIERVVLYGSRARGDAGLDSDYDVAVFLVDVEDRWAEIGRLADIEVAVMDATGEVVHAMPYPAGSWRDSTPLKIRRDGRDL